MPITGGIAAPKIIPLKSEDKETLSGCIDTQTFIEIVSDTPNARLYFTTNGKNPNPWKRKVDGREVTFVYKAPFALRPGKRIVKAMAVHSVTNVESHTVTRKFKVIDSSNNKDSNQLHNGNKLTGIESDEENSSSDALEMLDNYDNDDDRDEANGHVYSPAIIRKNDDYAEDVIENFMRRNADQGFAATNHSGTQINLWGQMPGLNWDIRTPNSGNISGSYPILNSHNLNNNTVPFWSTQPPMMNMENFVSPQQLSAIANHLTQCIDQTRHITVTEVRDLIKQITEKFAHRQNDSAYSTNQQSLPTMSQGMGNINEQIEHVKCHLIDYTKRDKIFEGILSQAKMGSVISADLDENDDSYLLTIHLDKPIKAKKPHRGSQDSRQKNKPLAPSKPPASNRPSSFNKENIPSSPEKLEPTLKPADNFNVDKDCEQLHQAMAGMGTNEKSLIEVMGHRSSEQRVVIVQKYKSMYGKDLTSKFKSELSGSFYDCMEALCYSPVELDARELRRALKGAGTDEGALIEILCSRTNAQIKQIRETYAKIFPNRDLEADVKSDTSRHFKRVCVALLQANRDESLKVDMELVRKDAENLYRAGEQKLGTDESRFVQVLISRSFAHLRLLFEEYSTIGKKNIEDTLKAEMHGDTLQAFLSIVSCIKNKPKYFAEKLHKSMKGLGTDNRTLIRIIVSRCEVDLGIIKKEFLSLTGKTLESYIHDDTSGDFRLILLALVGS
ncbi:unnamed protein product [Schistosoma turkestanicum]|nr:unnamed protein product [Schistosoma turkestanicum]